jgi:REP element-mobilizing transposase RayT
MARPLRLEFPGALYHVTSRGNARQPIYAEDEDRRAFMTVLAQVVARHGWLCHAFCLMDNHYHLLIETRNPNLSAGMRQLNGVYTQRYNRRHGRVGHVFQGRFKAIVVDRDGYLLELARYIVLNPVRAGMVKNPARYYWSSYRATAGLSPTLEGLSCNWLLSQFSRQEAAARRRYVHFVREGNQADSPWLQLEGQIFLGGEEFIARLKPWLHKAAGFKEIPCAQRYAGRPSLAKLIPARVLHHRRRRNAAIHQAFFKHGYRMSEIARHVGLHYSSISKILKAKHS